MGVDMVEIDVRLTKDSIPVLMHDKTIDRTTTGKGNVADWTLEELKSLYIKNGANHTTHHKIPTLEEALYLSKNKILLNLDKCYNYFDVIYPIIKKTNTTKQILMKGKASLEKVKKDFGNYLGDISFMPIINLDKEDAFEKVNTYLNDINPPLAIEFVFSDLKSPIISQFESIDKRGTSVWVNSLWESLNAGYEDDLAVQYTDSIYGWYVKNNISMIQTDRPQLLLDYLRANQLHN
jgi:glycerophosphoryl diester phosphodiesterase